MDTKLLNELPLFQTVLLLTAIMVGLVFVRSWLSERRREAMSREKQAERQAQRDEERLYRQQRFEEERAKKQLEMEEKRFQSEMRMQEERLEHERKMQEEEHYRRMQEAEEAQRVAQANTSGLGSGGYIVIDMSEQERPLFHDLLKGFEDYAKLRGYQLSFSIDSSVEGRIAFKFTVRNDGVVVGTERVRKDFHDYLEQVRRDDHFDALDKLPVITSVEEHNLLIALMKNRISFLQHSYTLSRNAVQYYESLLTQRTFPALPAQSIVVHTGGQMDSRNYHAVNSSRLIQGEGNTNTDSSTNINIGSSFNEKQARIAQLDTLLKHLEKVEADDESARKASRELSKVKDELTESNAPDTSAVTRWMHRAKDLLSTAKVGAEVAEAAHKLYETFGL